MVATEGDHMSHLDYNHVHTVKAASMPWLHRLLFSMFDKFATSSFKYGSLKVTLPDGTVHEYGSASDVLPAVPHAPAWMELPPKKCHLTVKNGNMFFKIITRHDSGLGEAYMNGDFTVDDLGALMAIITANARHIEASRGLLGALNWAGDKLLYAAHLTRANTEEGSKKNIGEHYDAGNDMYKLFLDETLTYSSGIHAEGDSLHQAQLNKLDALIEGAHVTRESHVLEVGCGWGSCAIRAVQKTNCKWTGVALIYSGPCSFLCKSHMFPKCCTQRSGSMNKRRADEREQSLSLTHYLPFSSAGFPCTHMPLFQALIFAIPFGGWVTTWLPAWHEMILSVATVGDDSWGLLIAQASQFQMSSWLSQLHALRLLASATG
jgi:hypothetical protein